MLDSKFTKRFLSALFLGPLFLLVVYLGGFAFLGVITLCYLICLYEIVSVSLKTSKKEVFVILGFVYVTLGFVSFLSLRYTDIWFASLVVLLLGVWGSDIGAYFIGKRFGTEKPLPDLSPNKTSEGFMGAIFIPGALVAVSMMVLILFKFIILPLSIFTFIGAFVMGCIIGGLGQIGDLIVSYLKRQAQVKDTGKVIPGHGGLLDRVDSLLFVSIFYPPLLMLFMKVVS